MTRAITAQVPAVARGYARAVPTALVPGSTLRAVIYLRVSTAQQANTDRDAEGFSIPAQREACLRKAESLGAEVIQEYVDAGESARTAQRPGLQALLRRLAELRDVDYVIVHKVDRLARNRADDVSINLSLEEAGAQLVSVTENIDQTPSGSLMHGIMSSIAEFYSKSLATEVVKGMSQKAKKGGHPGLAPIGYLNVREIVDGYEIRTIDIDPERGPLVQWAFKAYASGRYSLSGLTEELKAKGLTYRATAHRPVRPVGRNKVDEILRNHFYIGVVTFQGVQYGGRHEALVSVETFAQVQALLKLNQRGDEKQRHHAHYLKGSVFCARCESRLSFTRTRGRGGFYYYFFCLGRHERRTECKLPHMPPFEIEDAVEDSYGQLRLGPDALKTVRRALLEALKASTHFADAEARSQRLRIARLEAERRKLLQAHLAGAVPVDLLREEQGRITAELASAQGTLARTDGDWTIIESNVNRALDLLSDPQRLYRDADPVGRKALNQAFFEGLYVDIDGIGYTRVAAPFAQLREKSLSSDLRRYLREIKDPDLPSSGRGLRETLLVEVTVLEPVTSSLRTKRSTGLSYTPVRRCSVPGGPQTEPAGSASGSPVQHTRPGRAGRPRVARGR